MKNNYSALLLLFSGLLTLPCALSANSDEIKVFDKQLNSAMSVNDSDGDGVPDNEDEFPNDPTEWLDTDSDGIGNNADPDDDGDGIPDEVEIEVGMDPLNRFDYDSDLDGDGIENKFEYMAGSRINDANHTPRNVGFYSSQANEEADIFLNSTDTAGLFFQSAYDTRIVKMRVKLNEGRIILSYSAEASSRDGRPPNEVISIYIDGQTIEFSESDFYFREPLNNYWDSVWSTQVSASEDFVDLRIIFRKDEDTNYGYLSLGEVFIPVSDFGPDSDGDGYADQFDHFPTDATDWFDNDEDGIGNNADPDDDGDYLPDEIEVAIGSNPWKQDSNWDSDRDSITNLYEYLAGSDPGDSGDTPSFHGVYSPLEDAETDHIFNTADYTLSDTPWGYTDSYALVNNEGNHSFTIKGRGKFETGNIVFLTRIYSRYSDYYGRLSIDVSAKIGNQYIDEADFLLYPSDKSVWQLWSIPVQVTPGYRNFEIIVSLEGGDNSNEFYLDQLFFPISEIAPNGYLENYFVEADYDGNGIADYALRDNTDIPGRFLLDSYLFSEAEHNQREVAFGRNPEDIPLSGDYDGDGIADVAVRRPSQSIFYVKNSSGNNVNSDREDGIQRIKFGLKSDDIPVTGDFDGDRITDFAVRRASSGMWYIKNSSGSNYNSAKEDSIQRIAFGRLEDDIPVPADYDGDGITDIAVRRPGNFTWYILESSTGEIRRTIFGKEEGDIPIPADYDGDGKADLAVRRISNNHWYVLRSSDNTIQRSHFGMRDNDIPVVADYDGDGKADLAIRRPDNGNWYVRPTNGPIQFSLGFGESADLLPVMTPIWQKLILNGWDNDFLGDFRYSSFNARGAAEGGNDLSVTSSEILRNSDELGESGKLPVYEEF